MLSARRSSDGVIIEAWSAQKAQAPFTCASCAQEVILRQGRIQIEHFAHKPPITCSYGFGESEEHRRCKREIFERLCASPCVTDARLEWHLGEVRPDVTAVIGGVHVAIEVQISNLSLETVLHRTLEYTRRGMALLWLAQWSSRLEADRISPLAWERWLHAAYFGKVFYWKHGSTIAPVHFDSYDRYVAPTEWRNEYGEEQSAGGYFRTSKRYRTPVIGSDLDLITDLRRLRRGIYTSNDGMLNVPPCIIYTDTSPKFW